jgi:hypothetical protein
VYICSVVVKFFLGNKVSEAVTRELCVYICSVVVKFFLGNKVSEAVNNRKRS